MLMGPESLYDYEYKWLIQNEFKIVNTTEPEQKEKFLIATKKLNSGEIKIFGEFLPAHFFRIEVSSNKHLVEFRTGSGSLTGYMKVLMPIITEFLAEMICIKVVR